MIVKVCGITNREDAMAAIAGGASALGFNFYPRSPRYIDPNRAAEIVAGLPAHIWKAGVFVNELPQRIAEIASQASLDIAQLHGDETESAYPAGIRIWKAARVEANFRVIDLEVNRAEAILLDAAVEQVGTYGGTGRTFDWTRAAGSTLRIILAGGLDASNVRQAIAAANPWGVDVCSRIESEPGRKDHVKMAQFLKEATQ